jgi:hypothetical protein
MATLGNMREVSYTLHEYLQPRFRKRASLLTFVYDVPYLDACGIFPPLHILNIILQSGGDSGGMGPGATWRPFRLIRAEFEALVAGILKTPPQDIPDSSRYAWVQFRFDHDFDNILDRFDWMRAACDKHRAEWHEAVNQGRLPGAA